MARKNAVFESAMSAPDDFQRARRALLDLANDASGVSRAELEDFAKHPKKCPLASGKLSGLHRAAGSEGAFDTRVREYRAASPFIGQRP